MVLSDTILAVSSPPHAVGAGGVRGILRISGPDSWPLARAITSLPESAGAGYHANLALFPLHPSEPFAAANLFKGPRSFTGEDVAELHVPNSPAVLGACIQQLLESPLRPRLAAAGEFSARAFFNNKIDLTEAEGIAATINAANLQQLRAAASLRQGNLHRELARCAETLADLLARIEAGIDFTDEEDVQLTQAEKVESTLEQLGEHMNDLVAWSPRVDRLDSCPTVVLLGKPNVGKSSLINALTSEDRALVSDIAGTTRDMLAATLQTPAGPIRILDVPGEEPPADELRTKMMEARARALLEADLVIGVCDHTESPCEFGSIRQDQGFQCLSIGVQNKLDLNPNPEEDEGSWLPGTGKPWGQVSAKTGENIDKLREVITQLTTRHVSVGPYAIALNQRHRSILTQLQWSFWDAAAIAREPKTFHAHPELLAADLRHALDLLGQITGAISPDDVLGRIFSQFCIGK